MLRTIGRIDFGWVLLFLYFGTLHADQLNWILGGYTVRFNNLAAFALIILVLVRLRSHLFSINKLLAYPLLFITLSLITSLALSSYKTRCSFYLGWYGLTVLCYVLLPYFIVKIWDAHKVFSLYLASFICVGLYAALQLVLSCVGVHDPFATQWVSENIVRPNAFCSEPSFYALYMTPCVFFYNARFLTSSNHKSIWPLLGVNALYIISTSTAIFFAYGFFLLLLFCVPGVDRKRLMKFAALFCASLLALSLFFPFILKYVFMKFFYQGFMTHHSFYERWVGIENGWRIFSHHPLFGVGLGGYPCYLMDAYLKGDATFLYLHKHALISEVSNPVKLFEAMNAFTELVASLGIAGLCAFVTLLYGLIVQAKKILPNDRSVATSIFVSLLMTLLVMQFNQGLLRTYIWVHFAITFAYLEHLSSEKFVTHHARAL